MAVELSSDLLIRLVTMAGTIGGVYALVREKLKNLQISADALKITADSLKTGMDQQVIINRSFEQRLDSHKRNIEDLQDTTQELDKRVAVVEDRCSVRSAVTELRHHHGQDKSL